MRKLVLFLIIGFVVVSGFMLFRKFDHPVNSKKAFDLIKTTSQSKENELLTQSSVTHPENSFNDTSPRSQKIYSTEEKLAKKSFSKPTSEAKNLVTYTIDAGVVVTQGDIIIGELDPEGGMQALSGQVPEPQVRTWPTNEIPYFVQADLPDKERVIEALRMFSGTRVHFIPYQNHNDAIVFERREGVCKSYVGYIGGLQKIYLSDQCGPTEVAHEIMHSLGFVHEQNRFDRDQFINIFWDNIEPDEKINFEKFSGSAMKATGASSFDFQSIMMYPETMFSRNQSPTMKPIDDRQKIIPSEVLSPKDVDRINAIY